MNEENNLTQNSQEDSGVVDEQQSSSVESSAFVPEQESQENSTKDYKDEGWSWGGFAFSVMFAVAVDSYWYLALFILMMIPFVNIFAGIALMIYFGVNGREMARKSKIFSNKEQYLGFMKGIDRAGKVIGIMYLLFVVFVIIGLFSGATFISMMR